jgi:hypothetical protein
MYRWACPIIVATATLCGCSTYIKGEISFIDHPEIREASMFDGRYGWCGQSFGRIEKRRQGTEACSDLAAAVIVDLIAEAKARGAQGIRDVQFHGRRRWHPGVLCREVGDGRLEAYAVGFAYSGCSKAR